MMRSAGLNLIRLGRAPTPSAGRYLRFLMTGERGRERERERERESRREGEREREIERQRERERDINQVSRSTDVSVQLFCGTWL